MEQTTSNFNLRCDFGIRLAAILMDTFIIAILIFLFSLVGFASLFTGLAMSEKYANNGFASGAFAGGGIGSMIAIFGLGYVLTLCYGLIEAFTGASPGKRILGLQIANANGTQGNFNLYFKRWIIKNIGYFLSLISFVSWLGGLYNFIIFIGCFAALGEKKQALHDTLAKTAVFRKKDIIVVENI